MKLKTIILALATVFSGCTSDIHLFEEYAYFKSFTYTGEDPEFEATRLGEGEIFNPILQGSYSDASICRKGNDYYMVTATYTFFPGLAILHSRDLVNWEQINYALSSERQCLNTSLSSNHGVFPSTIRYNENDDYFYITGTFVGSGGHFIIKTKDPAKEWSDPEWIYGLGGVHPSLFIDDDGKAYLLNQGGPDFIPPYSDYKVIWIQPFDLTTLKNYGERKIILAGGDLLEKRPVWLERPHINKIGEYYYLTASEGGGLGNGCACCVYRSKNVFGPYTRYDNNPILTQRRLSPSRDEAVIGTGHTDFVKTPEGSWYAVFQGMRSYSATEDYNQGRETFMMPVSFNSGWPYIINNGENIPLKIAAPGGVNYVKDSVAFQRYIPHGNFTYHERFTSDKLPMQWFHLRTPVTPDYIKPENLSDGILIPLEINNIRSVRHAGFIAMRQMHNHFSAETELHFVPENSKEFAGLALFASDKNNYEFGITMRDNIPTLMLQKAGVMYEDIVKEEILKKKLKDGFQGRIILKAERLPDGFEFSYKFNQDDDFEVFTHEVSAEYLSAQRTKGFYGTVIGMYASKEEDED